MASLAKEKAVKSSTGFKKGKIEFSDMVKAKKEIDGNGDNVVPIAKVSA